MTVHQFIRSDASFHCCQESGSRVVFGKNKHNNPPPVKNYEKLRINSNND